MALTTSAWAVVGVWTTMAPLPNETTPILTPED